MHVLWFIGNGFDVNLGLQTSYKNFCDKVYFQKDEFRADREKLEKLEDGSFGAEDLLWSDLELLLGKSTVLFKTEDIDDFHSIFEKMEAALRAYLIEEQNRHRDRFLQDGSIDEFWRSITQFENRLLDLDEIQLGPIRGRSENHIYDFISLNYTSCFDEMLDKAKEAHRPFDRHGGYQSSSTGVFHIHGTLDQNGAIVFGVSDSSQIANPELAEDEEFTELWVKENKNAFYRNTKTQQLRQLIANARVVCAFGVSLGETDSYIWKTLGEHIAGSSNRRFVLFDHAVELPGGINGRNTQKMKRNAFARVCRAFGWDEQKAESYKDRVLILPSATIFSFSSDADDAS